MWSIRSQKGHRSQILGSDPLDQANLVTEQIEKSDAWLPQFSGPLGIVDQPAEENSLQRPLDDNFHRGDNKTQKYIDLQMLENLML